MSQLHLHVVTYLVAYRTVDKEAQVEVLVTEGVVPTEGELRQWRADVGLIILIDDAVLVHILEFQVAYECGVRAAVECRIGVPALCAVGIRNDRIVLLQGVHR